MFWRTLGMIPLIGLAVLLTACSQKPTASAVTDQPANPEPAPAPATRPATVKLAVVVVFDQMRGDYLEKWQPLFGEGGFKRLQTDGAWFPDCHYPYGVTTTAPGHMSILAGCSGETHGIINNNWYDRAAGEEVYSAGSSRYEIVPPKPKAPDAEPKKKSKPSVVGNPDKYLGETLADALKAQTAGKGKVVGVSLKDRSAIFPSGRKPDGVYWFDGRFATSTYYRDSLPTWVSDFNKNGTAESWYGKPWERLNPDLDYDKFTGIDDGPGEGKGKGQGVTFPHPMTGGKDKLGPDYYEALANSPYGNDLLLAFAKAAIVAEGLGQDDVPDLLTISFSSNDLVGHTWGPDSHEVLDVTLRSDKMMADLLTFLDEKIGKGNYSLVVTADHGVSPNPEVSTAKGLEGKRVSPTALLIAAERFLRDAYGKPTPDAPEPDAKPTDDDKKERNLWIEAVSPPHIYLNHRLLKAKGIDIDDASRKLAGWAATQPGMARAFTKADLVGEPAADDKTARQMKRSFHPDRGGDVIVVTKPFAIFDSYTTGTTHGTPHSYDTHAVFLAYGPGVTGGRRADAITPLHACPYTATFLGIKPPKSCQYERPAEPAK